ncbi:MAG: hypothetical protein KME64_33515 [Scytonematopsis contorta HA4267-MV1]|nr:hypothetical protein [Scytonematopsis contorta HA4267-MV1]
MSVEKTSGEQEQLPELLDFIINKLGITPRNISEWKENSRPPMAKEQEELRELLNFIVNELGVTQVELSSWMGVSRPLVNKFLKYNEQTERLPIKREGLIDLCTMLGLRELINLQGKLHNNHETSKPKSSSVNANSSDATGRESLQPEQLRRLFAEVGVDELLEAAGLLPVKTQVIRVTPERFVPIAQMAALFELLSLEDLLSTTQGILSIISPKLFQTHSEDSNSDALEHLIESLEQSSQLDTPNIPTPSQLETLKSLIKNQPHNSSSEIPDVLEASKINELESLVSNLPKSTQDTRWKLHPILGVKRRLDIIKKLRQASQAMLAAGKTKFSQQEAISLFLSIAIKERIPNNLPNLHIRVQKVEFKTLSYTITRKKEYNNLYQMLVELVYDGERKLKNPKHLEESEARVIKPELLDLLDPVLMVTVTSRFGLGESEDSIDDQLAQWTYTSSNTMLENAMSACGLLLGISEEIANIIVYTKALDGGVYSLVEACVVIGKNQHQYQGIWVDRDLTIVILQATVCAAKQRLAEQEREGKLDLQIYVSACKSISKLRQQIDSTRKAFQDFDFCKSEQLNEAAKTAQDELIKIPNQQIYFSLRLSLYRSYLLAKLLQLRLMNLQGDIKNAGEIIKDIESVLNEDEAVKNELFPIQTLLQAERYLYKLSSGDVGDLSDSASPSAWLELDEWNQKIRNTIKPRKFYRDPGFDVYQALSEIYGNYARMKFYLSHDDKVLKTAAEEFLQAAHYALRIGSKQRAARWFALAGRVWVRLGDENFSKQALAVAEELAPANLTSGHSRSFRQAIYSEINLLRGEILLVIQDNSNEAIKRFLEALKGSTYLKLNRRMCDALINIARCSEKLDNRSVKNDLENIFTRDGRLFAKNHLLEAGTNPAVEKVIKLLHDLWEREDNPTWYTVRQDFSSLAAEIWQKWHDSANPKSNKKHPIVEQIENGKLHTRIK